MAGDVREWLEGLGLGKYAEAFAENEVELRTLPHLDQDDLKELGVALGHRKLMLAAIAELSPAAPTLQSEGRSATPRPIWPSGYAATGGAWRVNASR